VRNRILLPLAVLLGCLGVAAAQAPTPISSAPPALPPQPVPVQTAPPPRPVPVQSAPLPPPPPSPPPAPQVQAPRLVFDPTPAPVADGPPADVLPPICGPFCNKFWIGADYLLWWTKDNRLPPLLTTGSVLDARPGALGQPGTSVLYGGDVDSGTRSGGRLYGGWWFDDAHRFGIDGTFFFLDSRSENFSDVSNGVPVLAVPYFNVNTNKEGALPLAFPGSRAAGVAAQVSNRLWGADTDFRYAAWRTDCMQVSLLAGFRYLQLQESLQTSADVLTAGSAPSGPGSEFFPSDRFATRNDFYGGQLGADVSYYWRGFFLEATAKIALGGTNESAMIDGSTLVNNPLGGQFILPFGGLAMPTNIGCYSRTIFTVVPEANVSVGYQITRHLRATVGYTFLYTNRAVRPGDVIDTGVNPTVDRNAAVGTPVIGPPRPTFPGLDSDFWAQGLNFGLEFRY
jgi:hypothetical protein